MEYVKVISFFLLLFYLTMILTNLLKYRLCDGVTPENAEMVKQSIRTGVVMMVLSGIILGISLFI